MEVAKQLPVIPKGWTPTAMLWEPCSWPACLAWGFSMCDPTVAQQLKTEVVVVLVVVVVVDVVIVVVVVSS